MAKKAKKKAKAATKAKPAKKAKASVKSAKAKKKDEDVGIPLPTKTKKKSTAKRAPRVDHSDDPLVLVNFKVPLSVKERIQKNAKSFGDGVVSRWMRDSAVHYRPAKGSGKKAA